MLWRCMSERGFREWADWSLASWRLVAEKGSRWFGIKPQWYRYVESGQRCAKRQFCLIASFQLHCSAEQSERGREGERERKRETETLVASQLTLAVLSDACFCFLQKLSFEMLCTQPCIGYKSCPNSELCLAPNREVSLRWINFFKAFDVSMWFCKITTVFFTT